MVEIEGFQSKMTESPSNMSKDMDLIDVLWRQDIDLGICREAFDLNLRKELEKEQELNLQQQREKDKEVEIIKQKLQEGELQKELENIGFVVDGETGERIPAPLNDTCINSTTQLEELNPPQLDEDEGLSIEEAMKILEENTDAPMEAPFPVVNSAHLQQQLDNLVLAAESYNLNNTPIQQNYQRQASFEQRWQDIATILDLPPTANTAMNYNLTNSSMNMVNALIQNTSMVSPSNMNTTLSPSNMNTTYAGMDPAQPTNYSSVLHNNASFAPPINASTPLSTNNSFFDLDSQEFLFPNVSNNNTQPDNLNHSAALLQELLSDDMSDLNLPEINFTDGLHDVSMIDDASSDSAVSSMESLASPVQDFGETSSTTTSTSMDHSEHTSSFDGLEGAAGADYQTSTNKYVKYEKYGLDCAYSDYDFQSEDLHLNYSSSSNESDISYKPIDMRHIKHNHTYPLLPGQQPREYKGYSKKDKNAMKKQASRDQRKAKALKVPLKMEQIIHSPVEEFNELMQKYPMNEAQLQLVRDIRRRGKNKVAAQNCRKRKLDMLSGLGGEVQQLENEREQLMQEREDLGKQTSTMRDKFQHLYQEVFASLRDENGLPYDPSQYSLQQSSDGNVFLVPRNSPSETLLKQKPEKRKSFEK